MFMGAVAIRVIVVLNILLNEMRESRKILNRLVAFRIRTGYFFFNLCVGTLGTAATTGLLYQPRIIGDGDCEEIGGIKIGRGNRSTRRTPSPAPFVHHKSHMTRPGFEPGPPRWEGSD
jgi:hypothetical protein